MRRNASSTIANTTSRHSRTYSSIPCPTHRRDTARYCNGQRRGLTTTPSSSGFSLSRTSAGDSASAKLEPKPTDPRPRWLFTTSSLLRVLVVPGEHLTSVVIFRVQIFLSMNTFFSTWSYNQVGLIYAVFYHDFGKEEHVFMPVRLMCSSLSCTSAY